MVVFLWGGLIMVDFHQGDLLVLPGWSHGGL